MLTSFEYRYLCAEPFLPVVHRRAREWAMEFSQKFQQAHSRSPQLLDVGGRRSHYTIGTGADVWVTDIPPRSEIQQQLRLGFTSSAVSQLRSRRSNVRHVIFDDMTHSGLKNASFDGVISIEVLEHVEHDEDFVREVARVLRPGGWFFMTTPNGDFLENHNPDHKRHYFRGQLQNLLLRHFEEVQVEYGVRCGSFYDAGLQTWSLKYPLRTALAMLGNVVNGWESSRAGVTEQSSGTQHLLARARKARA